ncbi:coiled-coil domain-containing protein 55 (DUF2040) domain-containing protein [Phthorimaea operculella]|nr:coiled-coil domain-containing protein 55 (DUF2040) domain-containing protein [Phthorimaea operculella]
MSSNKKYGLILPGAAKPQAPAFQASRNVFGDDSDSDNEASKKPVLLRPSQNVNRQAKIEQEKAIQEDPTVYQYDEIYDSMATQKEQKKSKTKEDKKPRYIENLLKTATKRKIENERRIERQIQKEREKEGDEFADKEVFVTSAYKKKLEEMKLEEEKEKREEYLESIGDVTKQRDLGGFYRHLYEQKLGSDKESEDTKQVQEKPKESDGSTTPERPQPETFKKKHSEKPIPSKKSSDSTKRNYRKRKSSSEISKNLSEGEIDDSGDEINRINLQDIRDAKRSKKVEENIDADSDFSVNDPSEDEKPPPKPKIDIWKKRTVGEVFEQALKRYYERKAARGC